MEQPLQVGSPIRVAPSRSWPGMRLLRIDGRRLWASRGYALLQSTDAGETWEKRARFPPPAWRDLTSRVRLTARLCRDGFHNLLVRPDGGLVGVVPGAIVVAGPGEERFRTAFRVTRGTRPLALAQDPQGRIYFGEYFGNPDREEVHVHGSDDGGETWHVARSFPAGSIRHVHRVFWDPFDRAIWVLTGDYGDECRILRTEDGFRTVEVIRKGGQEVRTKCAIPARESIVFATDSPLEPNRIFRLDRSSGDLSEVGSLPGSGSFACTVGPVMIFSSAVEPSRTNRDRHATLVGSNGGEGWEPILRWRKDCWPMHLFQYGTIALPEGDNETDSLFATGVAVREADLTLVRFDLETGQGAGG